MYVIILNTFATMFNQTKIDKSFYKTVNDS